MKRKAFTLIELSIVLIIVGLLIGGSFKMAKLMREQRQTTQAKESVKAASAAIIGYTREWIDLPTPQDFTKNLSPVQSKTEGEMFYFADPQLTNNTDICSINKTDLNVTLYSAGTLDRTVENVAFVLAHRSANHNMQTAVSGNNPYVIRIDDPLTKADYNSSDYTHTSDTFDDIVKWMTLSELQGLVDCSGKSLKIINDYALPRAKKGTVYPTVSIFADGGYPLNSNEYKWCIKTPSTLGWLKSNCNGQTIITSNCTTSTYQQCTEPTISGDGNITQAGTYKLIIYIKDLTKQISKSFTITVDP